MVTQTALCACSAGVLVTAADAFVLLLIEQWGVRQLEAVFGLFIAIMAGAFGIMYSNANIPQNKVVKGQCAASITASAPFLTAALEQNAAVTSHETAC